VASLVKTAISSDRKYFLVCIYVSKVLFLAFLFKREREREI